MNIKNLLSFVLVLTVLLCVSANAAFAQKRDHLNDMEIELVRDAQEIDRRADVFVKAIDRRFMVINDDRTQAKQIAKDIDTWGELPGGTRLQLFTDIRKILDEAINNIDDAAARTKTDAPIFQKAVSRLAAAANRFLPQLKIALTSAADDREKGAILASIEYCEDIIEASKKVKSD